VHIGVVTFVTDRGLPPHELAGAVEASGLESLFVTEHTHLPVEPGPTPWGSAPGPEYGRTLDPFVALAAAATATARITLGTAVALLVQHDPIAVAKAIASVDLLADGRLLVGAGFGWCRPEVQDHGVAFAQRRAVLAERVAAIRALWSEAPTAFDGVHTRFVASHAHPKPRRGAVPIYLGAPLSPQNLVHLRTWADGWMPSDRPSLVDDLRSLADDGVARATTVVGARPRVERLLELASAGVERVLLWLPPWPAAEVLRTLDDHAALAARFA
jgi:probable F420-dependent oxidoreductase